MASTSPRRYRLDLNYVGSQFNGWQAQPDKNSVQDHVENALATALRLPIRLTGASRTDSGVHARRQVATFDFASEIDVATLGRSLNALLPPTIGIMNIAEVAADFHPIRAAKAKVYRYWLWNSDKRNAFMQPYVWRWYPRLDEHALAQEARAFLGRHDFSAFCAANSSAKTKERTIFEIVVKRRGDLIEFWLLGDGFLKQMVRSMVGTLVDVVSGKLTEPVTQILLSRDRTRAGQTAPASGLCLYEIFYENVPTLADLPEDPAVSGS